MSVPPRPQWTLPDCPAHHTRLLHPHHTPHAEQIHSWSAGKGPTVCRPPCTRDCPAKQTQVVHIHAGQQLELGHFYQVMDAQFISY